MKRLFVDMDGTLCEFKAVTQLEQLYEKGYFERLKPQENVVDAVRQMCRSSNYEVYILSAVLTDSPYALDEKNGWLDRYLPEIDDSHRIFTPCGQDKKDFIPDISPDDYLLDDYTKNLLNWEPPAKGIKLLNGINDTHGTWKSSRLSHTTEPGQLQKQIEEIMSVGRTVKSRQR